MGRGFSLLFDDDSCVIRDKKKSNKIVAEVKMTANKLFPLELSKVENNAMVNNAMIVKENNESKLWHLRYGHLHIKGLKLLSEKEMVHGLPRIESLELYEGCTYGKQNKRPFPSSKS